MAPSKTKVSIAGVAEGKELIGVPTGDDLSPKDRVTAFFGGSMASEVYQGWAASLIRENLVLVSASTNPGRTVFSYTVQPSHCNRLGNLHGGCTSTIFDMCTTSALAPIAKPGFWAFAGVSRTLNVTYLRPVPVGEKVLVESEVVHAGKRLCSLMGVIRRESDGAVLATCEHGKVSIDPPASSNL
ncbi:related to thioesterase family protein [Rhynchosporium agropyri]|uniref:Related to thioesterase family protein n=3 Tax=Rhynchosporium TaxID=38037 RepID=A0A1E1M420_RHYSE|nr:related to thioesterase family protein [Rhynchosporium agropyri]CZT00816.1 related to thioesterase family protein [Rhynchosporium commune]CZT43860.1 related to thioesterase family protein [Rhynchosporium secalis]